MCTGSMQANRVGSSVRRGLGTAVQRTPGAERMLFNPGKYRAGEVGPFGVRPIVKVGSRGHYDALVSKGANPKRITKGKTLVERDGPMPKLNRVGIRNEGAARRKTRGARSQMRSETNYRSRSRKGTGLRIGGSGVNVPGT